MGSPVCIIGLILRCISFVLFLCLFVSLFVCFVKFVEKRYLFRWIRVDERRIRREKMRLSLKVAQTYLYARWLCF